MEKAHIVRYAVMQIVAIVYGVLASAAAVRFSKWAFADSGHPMSRAYHCARFYRDHGVALLILVVAWTVAVSYLASPLARWIVRDEMLVGSGIALAVFFLVLSTIIAIGAALPPSNSL